MVTLNCKSLRPKSMSKRRKYCSPLSVDDHISKLPDDILVSILLCLTLKEAKATTILSRRWRYLSTYIPTLDFADSESSQLCLDLKLKFKSIETERPRYIDRVDQVVKAHQAPVIDQFRICFDFNVDTASNIDEWVMFAIKKSVKRLELNFIDMEGLRWEAYSFPPMSSISKGKGFSSLTSLSLVQVDITGEVVEYFLSTCPFLEWVSVRRSPTQLVNLKVAGSSLPLKYLELTNCYSLKNLEIYAPNLTTFKFDGRMISMPLKSAPLLVDLELGGSYCKSTIYDLSNLSDISSYLFRLETLTLAFDTLKEDIADIRFPVLSNLKHLEVILHGGGNPDSPLLWLTFLIKAAPCLHRFVLRATSIDPRRERMEREVKFKYECLKVVELRGFDGGVDFVRFAEYMLSNSPSLEKMIIDPRLPPNVGTPWEDFRVRSRRAAANKKFKNKVPKGVDLVIL